LSPAQRLANETSADGLGNSYYADAVKAGIELREAVPEIEMAMRSLGAYYAYRPERFDQGYLVNPEPDPIHATSIGTHENMQNITPEEQLAGAKLFAYEMHTTLGRMFYDKKEGDMIPLPKIYDPIRRDVEKCAEEVAGLKSAAKAAKKTIDEEHYMGACLVNHYTLRPIGVAAAVEITERGGFKDNQIAQSYLDDFNGAVASGIMSSSPNTAGEFMTVPVFIYQQRQRDTLPEERQKHWDKAFGLTP
jgi:hypothetical protein